MEVVVLLLVVWGEDGTPLLGVWGERVLGVAGVKVVQRARQTGTYLIPERQGPTRT